MGPHIGTEVLPALAPCEVVEGNKLLNYIVQFGLFVPQGGHVVFTSTLKRLINVPVSMVACQIHLLRLPVTIAFRLGSKKSFVR